MACFVILRAYDFVKDRGKRKADKDLHWEVMGEKHPSFGAALPFTFEDERAAQLLVRMFRRENKSARFKVLASIHTDADLDERGAIGVPPVEEQTEGVA